MSIEDKKNPQREAYKKSKHYRIEQHRDYSYDLPGEYVQEKTRKPEDYKTEREKKYNSIISLRKSQGMEFEFGGRNTSQSSPQEPGSKDKTKSDFISVEMSREFSQ
jgi:hypothetical protein